MENHEFTKAPASIKPVNVKLESADHDDKKNTGWTLVKLKNNKFRVVSPDGKIIKIDEVYAEES